MEKPENSSLTQNPITEAKPATVADEPLLRADAGALADGLEKSPAEEAKPATVADELLLHLDAGASTDGIEESSAVEAKPSAGVDEPLLWVGVGASAGGLEAIDAFFANMPADTGMAFVVVQHLSPDYKSLMVELLSKRTPMSVCRAEEGLKVNRNTVYLIPPKKDLTIFHGKLMLHEQRQSAGLHLPIDVFFRSLAEDQGDKAVGIVLSGTGSDGTRGLRQIKEAGGMVLVQSPESAKFDGMPKNAIATGLADFILTPEEMPEKLEALLHQPGLTVPAPAAQLVADENDLDRVFALVRERCKVDFTYYKSSTVLRRLQRRMSLNQTPELRDYVSFLQTHPNELHALYRELLIGVTRFFRDPEVFQALADQWLPELLQRCEGREIRFWVAGCSTGEEAYTMAMILAEGMARLGKTCSAKIFATDVDQDAILRASAGIYPASAAADLPPNMLSKYFHVRPDEIQVSRNLREMVVFAQHNLIKDPPFTNIDLVSCRNMLIYLQGALQQKVLEFFNFSLNSGGLLVLGSSETIGDLADCFDVLHHKYKTFRAKGKRHPIAPMAAVVPNPSTVTRTTRMWDHGSPGRRAYDEDRLLDRLLQGLGGDYIPAAIVVNEQLEMLHAVGDISPYFKLQSGRLHNEITRMAVKDLAIPVATGVQRAFSTKGDVRYTNIRLQEDGKISLINLRIKLLPQKRGQEPVAVLLIESIQDTGPAPAGASASHYDARHDAEQRIADLENELQFTKENLQATIEELETSNEELQATNEELLASNEELQSTNEELQSVNEELHTVNAEHQMRIMELTEMTNDLNNLMGCTEVATLFMDENLAVRKFTPAVTQILRVVENDVGRPFADLSHRVKGLDLSDLVAQVQKKPQLLEREVRLDDGRWFYMRIFPYNIGPRTFSGVLLTFNDITRLKAAQEEVMRREQELKEMAAIAQIGRWEYDVDSNSHRWSEEVIRLHGFPIGSRPSIEDTMLLYTHESQVRFQDSFKAACQRAMPFDIILQTNVSNAATRYIRAIGRPVSDGARVVIIHGAFQNITRVTQAEQAQQASERQYRELFDNMTSGVAVYETGPGEAEFRLRDLNRAGETIIQCRSEAVRGRAALEFLPSNGATGLVEAMQEVRKSGKPLQFPVFHFHDQKHDIWLEHSIYKLSSGEIVVVFDDITERVRRDQVTPE